MKRDSKAEPKSHQSGGSSRSQLASQSGAQTKHQEAMKAAAATSPAINGHQDADHDDYFGTSSKEHSNYNTMATLYPSERYPGAGGSSGAPGHSQSSSLDNTMPPNDNMNIYGLGTSRTVALKGQLTVGGGPPPSGHTGPEPPPRIDRGKKPPRFRSAHERLFGRPDPRERDYVDDQPDYINTAAPERPDSAPRTPKNSSLERGLSNAGSSSTTARGAAYGETGSGYYPSPVSTLDERARYGNHSRSISGSAQPPPPPPVHQNGHDPYRFTRNSVPQLANGLSGDRGSKVGASPGKTDIYDRVPSSNGGLSLQAGPPSPPPKPSLYSTTGYVLKIAIEDKTLNETPS